MHKKSIVLLILLTVLVFGNGLFNDFAGDDEIILVHNTFYRDLSNLKDLFTEKYFPSAEYIQKIRQPYYSGEVAYRPVLTATYFLDYQLWEMNPFGYHLANLLLHVFNVVLVFFLLDYFFRESRAAFWGAALFAVHPVQVEAVCSISYRTDLLLSFFLLLAFHCFIRYAACPAPKRVYLFLSWGAYFLAVFTKESALGFLLILVAYDMYFHKQTVQGILLRCKGCYLGYILVSAAYAYIYFAVFPNSMLPELYLFGGTVLTHGVSVLWIFFKYVFDLTCPLYVTLLPPLYAPDVTSFFLLKLTAGAVTLGVSILVIRNAAAKDKVLSFFLSWFILGWIPISNIIPLLNPIAHRFLYFPSIGLLAVYGFLLERLCQKLTASRPSGIDKIIKLTILGLCITTAFPLTFFWRNTLSAAHAMTIHYPHHAKVYAILGITYYQEGEKVKAREYLLQATSLGSQDSRIERLLQELVNE